MGTIDSADFFNFSVVFLIIFICLFLIFMFYYKVNKDKKEEEKRRLEAIKKEEEERKKREEEERIRKNTPFYFNKDFSEDDFYTCVARAANRIERVLVAETNGPLVYCTILSNTAKTRWSVVLDYNDYGKITEKYWIDKNENYDSELPYYIGRAIAEEIHYFREKNGSDIVLNNNYVISELPKIEVSGVSIQKYKYCAKCGVKTNNMDKFCMKCGYKF